MKEYFGEYGSNFDGWKSDPDGGQRDIGRGRPFSTRSRCLTCGWSGDAAGACHHHVETKSEASGPHRIVNAHGKEQKFSF